MADCYLPEEILTEILSRLSVKSLLRFRCVCKTWRDLVSNPSFITKHLAETTDLNNNERLIILQGENNPNLEELFHRKQNNTSKTTIILGVKLWCLYDTMNYAGSCNGLICIVHYGRFVLWNPATNQHRYLPRPGLSVPCYQKCSLGLGLGFGFGFDPYTKDYKLVRFFCKPCWEITCIQYCEVYSKFTDSWRKINDVSQCNCCVRREQNWPGAVVSRRIHWMAYKYDDTHTNVILSFDMGKEMFQEISLPDFPGFHFVVNDLAVVDDSLALIVYDDIALCMHQCIEVWVMKEYGVHESWTKLIKIGPFACVSKPLVYFKNGDFILKKKKNKLFLYDSNIQKFGKLSALSPPSSSRTYIYDIHTYTESLVSVQGGY